MKIPVDPAIARADHQRAVRDFLSAARYVPPERWEQKPDAEHWSPAQIAEHIRMTYVLVGEQFSGGSGLRVRTSWYMRALLRWKFLKGLLESGVFPKGARAPREVRPGDGPFERDAMLAAIERAAQETENKLIDRWADPNRIMTHHVFGELKTLEGARLLTVHTAHHAAQLRAAAR